MPGMSLKLSPAQIWFLSLLSYSPLIICSISMEILTVAMASACLANRQLPYLWIRFMGNFFYRMYLHKKESFLYSLSLSLSVASIEYSNDGNANTFLADTDQQHLPPRGIYVQNQKRSLCTQIPWTITKRSKKATYQQKQLKQNQKSRF